MLTFPPFPKTMQMNFYTQEVLTVMGEGEQVLVYTTSPALCVRYLLGKREVERHEIG